MMAISLREMAVEKSLEKKGKNGFWKNNTRRKLNVSVMWQC